MVRLLIRVVVALAIVGVVAHEGGQILFTQTKADDVAHKAAQIGAETFAQTKNVSRARVDAAAVVTEAGGRLKSFSFSQDGKATVKVAMTASTLIVKRVSFLRRFGIRRAKATAPPPVL